MEHERQAATTDDTAIHDDHQRLERSLCQEGIDRRDTIPLFQDARVLEPSGQAFAPALGLRALGDFGGDAGQLGALAAHDTADERRQRGQVPCDGAWRLARIPWSSCVPYGTISAEVVTHCLLLLVWSLFPESIQ